MIRLIGGLFLVLGAIGGIEQFEMNCVIGFLFGIVGLILIVSPIKDGTLDHYLEK